MLFPLPRWTGPGAFVGCFPKPCCLPRTPGGSAYMTSRSRPAQALHTLRPVDSLDRQKRPPAFAGACFCHRASTRTVTHPSRLIATGPTDHCPDGTCTHEVIAPFGAHRSFTEEGHGVSRSLDRPCAALRLPCQRSRETVSTHDRSRLRETPCYILISSRFDHAVPARSTGTVETSVGSTA